MKSMDSLGTAARRVVVIDDYVAANGAQCVRQSLFTQSLQFTDDIVTILLESSNLESEDIKIYFISLILRFQ